MKISKILSMAFAAILLVNVSCSRDEEVTQPKGAYENGIIIANEGGFSTPTASISFTKEDLSSQENNIFSANNNSAILGNVLQSIGFLGDNAYLVCNIPNKIEIVNRYSFKKVSTITAELDNPRYIAFSGNYVYVTNNNFSNVRKLNIYKNTDNSFVKSINFEKYAERIVEAGGSIFIQTDGSTYDSNWNELPTGHSISLLKSSSNNLEKTITLTDDGIIKDLISSNGFAYVLSSTATESYIYKISPEGAFTKTVLTGINGASKLRIDNNNFYFNDNKKNIYSMSISSTNIPTKPIFTTTANMYGFGVINNKIYVSNASFSQDSDVFVYNTSGTQLKTFKTGVGTSGFYKN